MLAIRLQRTGRSRSAQFRVIVQDSRFSPKRGRIVAYLGSYDPHSKVLIVDGPKASQYLENGAQPSDRVARLLQKDGIKLPAWVKLSDPKKRGVRHPEKRRSTRPAEPAAPAEPPAAEPESPAAEPAAPGSEEPAEPAEETESAPAGEQPEPQPAAPAETEAKNEEA